MLSADMWKTIKVLSPLQVFCVSVVSAIILCLPVILYPVNHHGFLLDVACYFYSSLLIVALVGAFLGYYHAGLVGFIVAAFFSVIGWFTILFGLAFIGQIVEFIGFPLPDFHWGFLLFLLLITALPLLLVFNFHIGPWRFKESPRGPGVFDRSREIAVR